MSVESIEKARQRARELQGQVRMEEAGGLDLTALPPRMPVINGAGPGDWLAEPSGLPPHCPVTPLGYDDNSVWYLSARGTVTQLKAMCGKGDIALLFAPCGNYPVWAWPRWEGRKGQKKEVRGNFDADEARKCLFHAAALAGPWDPLQSLRGRGAWMSDGETPHLVLHLGDRLLLPDGVRPPGIYGSHVYPGRPALAGPALPGTRAADRQAAAQRILAMLETWNWKRGRLDAQLMMGWLACAFIGGALRWRPYIFVAGDKGKGKSHLLDIVTAVLGGEGNVLRSEDATEPGIAQSLGYDSVPVILDELENEAEGSKAQNIIRMARRSASGSQRIRGGQDHRASSFIVRSCFLFAAINMPTLDTQDMSRIAMLSLGALKDRKGNPERPELDEAARLGPLLFAQVLDWCAAALAPDGGLKFDRVLRLMRDVLMREGGHDDRGADTFGFLMAGYWAALHRKMPSIGEAKALCQPLAVDRLAEYEAIEAQWRRCWNHLLGEQPRALERAAQTSVGAILRAWRAWDGSDPDSEGIDTAAARRALARVGLGLKIPRDHGLGSHYEAASLFVPISDPALSKLFENTRWKASSRECAGAWTAALREGPEDLIWPDRLSLGRTQKRGTCIRIAPLVGYPRLSDQWDADKDGEG